MIVEDERMIRRGIIQGINWNELGFEVTAEAKNGVEALELLKTQVVDVVMTDIKMPVMDGIELSKKIREQEYSAEIVILSGFSEFEYAREAISFQAFDYLLKPTKKQKLIEIFKKLKLVLDEKVEEQTQKRKQHQVLNEGYASMRKSFLLQLLNGNETVFRGINEQLNFLELDLTGNCFTAVSVKIEMKKMENQIKRAWGDERMITYAYENIVNEILMECEKSVAVVKNIEEINLIFCFDSIRQQNEQMMMILKKMSKTMKTIILQNHDVKVSIGVGLTYPSILHIHQSYRQSQKALERHFFDTTGDIYVFNHLADDSEKQWIKDYPSEVSSIVEMILKGHLNEVRKLMMNLFERFEESNLNPEMIKSYCQVFKFILMTTMTNYLEEGQSFDLEKQLDEIIYKSNSIHDLQNDLIILSVEIANQLGMAINREIPNEKIIVEKAKNYIKLNYQHKITLQDISDEVHLSPNYLSGIFKKITGETYIDYLQKVRMKAAKKLLEDRSKKVYEIAFEIGYSDYKYFASKFKKMVGMSPKEYRVKVG